MEGQAPVPPNGAGEGGAAPMNASSGAAAAEPGAGGGGAPQKLPPQLAVHLERPTMAGDYEYENCDIVPIADPSQVTDMQKMAKAQIIEANMEHPNMNKEQGLRRILTAASIEDIDQLIVPTPEGPDPLMQANAEAEIMKKKAGAMKDVSLAEKASVETHAIMQGTAIEHAQVSSGALDQDRALEAETHRLEVNKTNRELALKERQQEIDKKAAEKAEKGEAS
jgi:hypothetical protein